MAANNRHLLTIQLPDDMYEQLTEWARRMHSSKGNVIRWALFDYMEMLNTLKGNETQVTGQKMAVAVLPMQYYVQEDDAECPGSKQD